MPYSERLIKDRQAVGQLRYQVRRFCKQIRAMDLGEPDTEELLFCAQEFLSRIDPIIDFYDDGTRMPDPEVKVHKEWSVKGPRPQTPEEFHKSEEA